MRAPSLAIAAGALAAACSLPPMTPDTAVPATAGVRLNVQFAQPAAGPGPVIDAARRAAGVPVDHVGAAGDGWHTLLLHCGDEASCAAAVERLRADRVNFPSVEPDQRMRPLAR